MAFPVDLSVVIELENVLLSGDARCARMLRSLAPQIATIGRGSELIVQYDPANFDASEIEGMLALEFADASGLPDAAIRALAVPGGRYYELKNHGARAARGQVVVFIDSDVIPEAGWLEEMTGPFFEHPEIEVLAGQTYLSHDSLVARAFALGWFFPLRSVDGRLHSGSSGFFANNVAFRRATLIRNPFPGAEVGVTRGSCAQLARTLLDEGTLLWANPAARTEHPPPKGLRHCAIRALAHGRDAVLRRTGDKPRSAPVGFAVGVGLSGMHLARATGRIVKYHRRVGLAALLTPVAIAIMSAFYSLAIVGSCATMLNPDAARTRWQI